MLVAERADLADTLADWMQRTRLEKAELHRLSGVGRNTLYRILDGMPAQLDTLRKIARGLATNPYSRDVDRDVYRDALRDLMGAAGLVDPVDDIPEADLESEIRSIVRSPRRAAALAAFVRRYPNMSADQRRLVDALIDHLGDE